MSVCAGPIIYFSLETKSFGRVDIVFLMLGVLIAELIEDELTGSMVSKGFHVSFGAGNRTTSVFLSKPLTFVRNLGYLSDN